MHDGALPMFVIFHVNVHKAYFVKNRLGPAARM